MNFLIRQLHLPKRASSSSLVPYGECYGCISERALQIHLRSISCLYMDCYCNLIPVQFGSTLEKRSYFVDNFSRLFRSTWYELPEIVISCLN